VSQPCFLALLETGAAKSELSKGVEIDGKKYYNFYGVGALDNLDLHVLRNDYE
jgi:beta-N-acetylglucosaminidase